MPLFMDHFRRNHSLADPLLITNQFSWLLVLMIASIRAMNSDRWSLRTHFIAHDVEAAAACSPNRSSLKALASRSARIDLADDFSRLKPIVQSNTNCTLKTHLMPLDLIGALFCHPRLKPNGKHRMAEWNQHPNTKSHHDHDFKYMK